MKLSILVSSSKSVNSDNLQYEIEYSKDLIDYVSEKDASSDTSFTHYGSLPYIVYSWNSIASTNSNFRDSWFDNIVPDSIYNNK